MKKIMSICPLMVAMAACVPVYGPSAMSGGFPRGPASYGPSFRPAPEGVPIGRWDNVMLLPVGAAVQVLTKQGTVTTATFVTATNTSLQLRGDSGALDIAAETIERVDRLWGGPAGTRSVARDAARGAALGAGAVGVLGLLAGHAPPARLFGAGAIGVAYENAEMGRGLRTSTIIYLAPGSRRE
jgi:hypothetical protein